MGLICLGDEYAPEKNAGFFSDPPRSARFREESLQYSAAARLPPSTKGMSNFRFFAKYVRSSQSGYCEEEEEASQKSVDQ